MPDSTPMEHCTVVAHQEMCVDADVTVMPSIHAGPVTTKCVGGLDLQDCGPRGSGKGGDDCGRHHPKACRFAVRQVICVSIPLIFGASVEAAVSGTECGTPKPGPCLR